MNKSLAWLYSQLRSHPTVPTSGNSTGRTFQIRTNLFSFVCAIAISCLLMLSSASQAQAPTPAPVTDQETELGQALYDQLKSQYEIVQFSPLYDSLRPIVEAISQQAQPLYNHPFKFYIVHEARPNAFSAPGGNVYIVDSLMFFVKNTEQLAGTICHEVSHTIHHDAMNRIKQQQKTEIAEIGVAILLGPTIAEAIAITMLGDLHSLAYSREVESAADITGSDICAAAGYNPWGLVWLFQEFENADPKKIPALLSDHPANSTRIKDLKQHFRDHASRFSKFDPDPRSATAFKVPEDAWERFLHP